MSVFSRNIEIEEAAAEVLNYTEDEVKRKTISRLTQELKDVGFFDSSSSESASNSNATDNNDEELFEEEETKEKPKAKPKSSPPREERREKESSSKKTVSFSTSNGKVVNMARLRDLKRKLQAKINMTRMLEEDEDFTVDDMVEWNESVSRLEDEIADMGIDYEKQMAMWKRKQEKIEEIDSLGLLDETLKSLWKQKQDDEYSFLKQFLSKNKKK